MDHNIVWFDVPVSDIDRAITFYSAVLNKNITKHVMPEGTIGILPHEGDLIGGCLTLTKDKISAGGPILYFNALGRLDQAAAAATANGGKVLKPKYSIGPHGFCVLVSDSEGNRIALHSMTA